MVEGATPEQDQPVVVMSEPSQVARDVGIAGPENTDEVSWHHRFFEFPLLIAEYYASGATSAPMEVTSLSSAANVVLPPTRDVFQGSAHWLTQAWTIVPLCVSAAARKVQPSM